MIKTVEVRKEDISKGDIYYAVSFSKYDKDGFREVYYTEMEIIEINDKSILVKDDKGEEMIVYGRKVGNHLYFRIKKGA